MFSGIEKIFTISLPSMTRKITKKLARKIINRKKTKKSRKRKYNLFKDEHIQIYPQKYLNVESVLNFKKPQKFSNPNSQQDCNQKLNTEDEEILPKNISKNAFDEIEAASSQQINQILKPFNVYSAVPVKSSSKSKQNKNNFWKDRKMGI